VRFFFFPLPHCDPRVWLIGARVMTCAFRHTNSDLPASGHLYYGMLLCTMLKLPLALEQVKLALTKDVRLPALVD
jgi:hypothetical protein